MRYIWVKRQYLYFPVSLLIVMPGWVVTMVDGASCIMQCSSNFATACRYYLPSPGVTQQTPAPCWLGTRNSRWQDTAIKRPNPPPVKRERVMMCNVCNGARLQILKQKQAIIHWPMRAAGWVLNSGARLPITPQCHQPPATASHRVPLLSLSPPRHFDSPQIFRLPGAVLWCILMDDINMSFGAVTL